MVKIIVISMVIALVGVMAIVVLSCPTGTTSWEGGCAALPSPEESTLAPAVGVVSDEKPPRHPEPAYERAEVTVDMPQSKVLDDMKMDQEKAEADKQGKKAAGIR